MFDRNTPTVLSSDLSPINSTITINLLDSENTLKHRVDMNFLGENPLVQSSIFAKPSKNLLQISTSA